MKVQYQFKSGLKVEGTIEEITSIAKALNEVLDLSKLPRPGGHYWSESKSTYVPISTMATPHIRNALCKVARVYFEDLSKDRTSDNIVFCKKFVSLADLQVIQDLYKELAKR